MKKTAFLVILLLVLIAIFADRNAFSDEIQIDKIIWQKMNVGATDAYQIGTVFTYSEALSACPEGYRLPTRFEFESLAKNRSKPTNYYGATGRWFSGKTPYDEAKNKIFLPRTFYNSKFDSGYYWSSTKLDQNLAYCLSFNAANVSIAHSKQQNKMPVRCVKK
jgi:uncharacterized protein (TIGR02145 family)